MAIDNEFIGQRVRSARRERKLTQKELADHLERSIGAISQLEKGIIQIAALDLFEIAKFLNKPIEFFFGEESLVSEVQDIVALLRKMPPDTQREQIQIMQATISFQQEQDIFEASNITDIEEARPHIEKVYKNLITWLVNVTSLRKQALVAKSQLEELLDIKDEDIIQPE